MVEARPLPISVRARPQSTWLARRITVAKAKMAPNRAPTASAARKPTRRRGDGGDGGDRRQRTQRHQALDAEIDDADALGKHFAEGRQRQHAAGKEGCGKEAGQKIHGCSPQALSRAMR
jgi:hypothetical protein